MSTPLTSPAVEAKVAAIIAEQKTQDAFGRAAGIAPLPGPTKEAFAIQPNLQVGPYSLRPFYDYDFEILSQLEHPLYQMMVAGMKGNASEEDMNMIPRGPSVWELGYLLTHSPEEVDELVEKLGIPGLRKAARREFSKLNIKALEAIIQGAVAQMGRYWAPTLGYGPEDAEGEQSLNPSK